MNSRRKKTQPHRTLRAWRDAHGFTIEQAAAVLGLSRSGYYNIERGDRHPRPEALKRIVRITGVPIEVLAGVA
jgi:transcriptional regulator with XRE-family HTH domain